MTDDALAAAFRQHSIALRQWAQGVLDRFEAHPEQFAVAGKHGGNTGPRRGGKPRKTIPQATLRRLHKRYRAGERAADLAAELRCSAEHLYAAWRKAGLTTRARPAWRGPETYGAEVPCHQRPQAQSQD